MLKTLRKIVLPAVILFGAPVVSGQQPASMDNPITKAVMDSYAKMLADDPNDYLVLFRRANEYYNHNMYADALNDVNKAIEFTPTKEKDIRFQCYSLRASIYERKKMFAQAINDYNSALALNPDSYPITYQKANTEFEMGNYTGAKATYERLQRLNPRSQEAMFGLAAVAVKSGNTAQASKLLDEAVALTPQNPDAYINRAAVFRMMGNNQAAVDDYIMALSLSDGSNLGRPLNALVKMSDTNYNDVVNSLSSAIQRAPRQGIFYYLRGMIAQNHFRYTSAITDFEYINTNYLLDYPPIYRQLAECYYALCEFDKALESIDTAIGSTADNIDSYVVKSDIKRAQKSYNQAITAADRALSKESDYAPALLAKGLAQLDGKFTVEGSNSVGAAVAAEPLEPYYAMVRAWSLREYLNNTAQADSYCTDVLKMTRYDETDVRSFRGFAFAQLGRNEDAIAWINSVIDANTDLTDGEIQYYAACLYAQLGDIEKGLAYTQQALDKGYANLYNWKECSDAGINVAPLRKDPRFDAMLTAHSFLFK